MKKNLKKKFLKKQKNTVLGAMSRRTFLQNNVDRISDFSSALSPTFSADNLTSISELESVDLLCEGPIEGFVNKKGELDSALASLRLDDTPVVEDSVTKKRFQKLELDNGYSGIHIDYGDIVVKLLSGYKNETLRRFPRKYIGDTNNIDIVGPTAETIATVNIPDVYGYPQTYPSAWLDGGQRRNYFKYGQLAPGFLWYCYSVEFSLGDGTSNAVRNGLYHYSCWPFASYYYSATYRGSLQAYGDKLGVGVHRIDTTDENAISFQEHPIQQPLSGAVYAQAQTQTGGNTVDYRGVTEELSISRLIYSQDTVIDLDQIWLGSSNHQHQSGSCQISNGRYNWACFHGTSTIAATYQNQITSGRPMKYQGQYSYSTAINDRGNVTGTTVGRAFSHLVLNAYNMGRDCLYNPGINKLDYRFDQYYVDGSCFYKYQNMARGSNYARSAMQFDGAWNARGQRGPTPSKYFYRPSRKGIVGEGLREPIIAQLDNLISGFSTGYIKDIINCSNGFSGANEGSDATGQSWKMASGRGTNNAQYGAVNIDLRGSPHNDVRVTVLKTGDTTNRGYGLVFRDMNKTGFGNAADTFATGQRYRLDITLSNVTGLSTDSDNVYKTGVVLGWGKGSLTYFESLTQGNGVLHSAVGNCVVDGTLEEGEVILTNGTSSIDFTLPSNANAMFDDGAFVIGGKNNDYDTFNSGFTIDAMHLYQVQETEQTTPSTRPNYAHMIFDASQYFGGNNQDAEISKTARLSFSVGDDANDAASIIDESDILPYFLREVTGYKVIEDNNYRNTYVYPVIVRDDGGTASSNYTQFRQPYIMPSTSGIQKGMYLEPHSGNKFKGAFAFPIYLGTGLHEGSGSLPPVIDTDGSFDTGRFILKSDVSSANKNAAINSGQVYGYDVLQYDVSSKAIQYLHVANPELKGQPGLIKNKEIGLRITETEPSLFNYSKVSIQSRKGEESQSPIMENAYSSFEYQKVINGPYNPRATNMDNATGAHPSFSNLVYGIAKNSAQEGDSSVDNRYNDDHEDKARPEKVSYTEWINPTPLEADRDQLNHRVGRPEVESVIVTLLVQSLYEQHIDFKNVIQPKLNLGPTNLRIGVLVGFDGFSEEIGRSRSNDGIEQSMKTSSLRHTPVETVITIRGVARGAYAMDTNEIPLPSHTVLQEYFPNESLKSLEKRFHRFVKVRKLTYETDSTLISREVSVYQIIEKVPCNFTYPSSALAKVNLDARQFNTPPRRTFDLRMKKIQIPSNYYPLDVDGRDRRFIDDASKIHEGGNRMIYDGDWDGTFKIGWTDNPVWIIYDLLTNQDYGIGNRLDDLRDIDIFQLYKIGRYCDAVDSNGKFVGLPDGFGGLEPRYSCNILLEEASNGFELIKELATSFQGMAYYADGKIRFYSDQPRPNAAHFNNQNVFDGIFNYEDTSKVSRFTVVDVQFLDKRDDYKLKVESVEDEDGLRKNGIIRRSVNARGATSRSQARRLGKYILYSNKLEREIVSFETSSEALMLTVGDVFTVNDELKQFEPAFTRVASSEVSSAIGSFRYYKFLGTNRDNTPTETRQGIREIHLVDSDGITYPTTDFSDSDLAGGGSDTTGPYVQGGLTVTAGYSHSETYGPHEAFKGTSQMWWTLGLNNVAGENADLNHLTVDFGSAKTLTEIQVEVDKSNHDCLKLRILASNSADFSSFEVFGEIDYQSESNITDLNEQNVTVKNGKIVTIAEGGTISASNLPPAEGQIFVEKTFNTGSFNNNRIHIYNATGASGVDDYFHTNVTGGKINATLLDDYQRVQAQTVEVTGISEVNDLYRLEIHSDYNVSQVPQGSFVGLDLQHTSGQTFKVIEIKPTENNRYAVLGGEYNSGKYDLIEAIETGENKSVFFDKIETPHNIGIPQHEVQEISAPLGFETSVTRLNDNTFDINYAITGALNGNEEAYDISLVFPNGRRFAKTVAKGTEVVGSSIRTSGFFNGLYTFGNYNMFVKSFSGDFASSELLDKTNQIG
jgi:hypothetical protein